MLERLLNTEKASGPAGLAWSQHGEKQQANIFKTKEKEAKKEAKEHKTGSQASPKQAFDHKTYQKHTERMAHEHQKLEEYEGKFLAHYFLMEPSPNLIISL